ncbi:MAG: molybdopterin dinucleotide binding domain-containing protein [Deltaproteobacteria bacterium]|nr:molybdopterin dinucleotide binding domain-containing protein [Deltaproteobacteria bacterium]
MASLSPKFAGISHARIAAEGGLQWPCPTPDHPGTPTLHEGGPIIGKATFQPVAYRPSAEVEDVEYPFLLSTGRTLYQYNAATQTRRDPGTALKDGVCFLEMHRHDAKVAGLEDGQRVRVSSRRGSVEARLSVSSRVRPGRVWMPFHYAEARANLLTNDAGDTVTGTAEYKVCAVKVDGLGDA